MAITTKVVFREEDKLRKRLVTDPSVTIDDKIGLSTWVKDVQHRGIKEVQEEEANNDLKEESGKWIGYRSALINREGKKISRVIYQEVKKDVVEVVEIIDLDTDYYDSG